jgi:GNAT superfamily N-acetyltransferase
MKLEGSTIRRLSIPDCAQWDALWRAYCGFYRSDLDSKASGITFNRLCAGVEMVGVVAADSLGNLVGFANMVFHQTTWAVSDCCYLEDLYVAPHCRGAGAARQLITQVYAEADARNVGKVYWHTQEFNAPARSLYDTLARRTSFVVYRR